MRRTLIVLGIALLAAVPWARAAEETVESLGFEEEPVKESMFAALRGWYQAPTIPAPVRSMPAEQKVAAVQVLGAFAKTYVGSSEFKKDYGQAYKASRPHTGFAMPSFDALKKSATDKAAEQVTGPKAEAGVLEKDPKVQLRKRLEAFLAATEDVDYAAATRTQNGMRFFEKAEYEKKPNEWKMCYRAGRETAEALRGFATDWVAELK